MGRVARVRNMRRDRMSAGRLNRGRVPVDEPHALSTWAGSFVDVRRGPAAAIRYSNLPTGGQRAATQQ